MTCAVVSVNRALGVLAVVWMVVAKVGVATDAEPDMDDRSALQVVSEVKHPGPEPAELELPDLPPEHVELQGLFP